MAYESSIRQYRQWYSWLLRLHSKSFYERFGEGMEQTFNDLLQERAKKNIGLFGCALWIFFETSMGIIRENVFMKNKNILRIAIATVFLLFIPLIAMQFTKEVVWGPADFIVAGILLFGTGLTYELIARRAGTAVYKVAAGIAVGAALLLVWVNLAVGLIGSEKNPANLIYFGVLAVGLIGAAIARLEPRGMARTLFAMAIGQALVPVIAMMIWRLPVTSGVVEVVGVNFFFIMLFIGSALLFQRASATSQTV